MNKVNNIKEIYNAITFGIKDYFKKNNFQKAVIGLSGGVDSSTATKLLVNSIGSKNVTALLMPEIGISNKKNLADSVELAKNLKIKYYIIEINDFLNLFKKNGWNQNKFAIGNTKARIRANILYNYANSNNAIVVGTTNKSELALGYGTKFGDLASDIFIFGDLWKTHVLELARFLKIPEKIINKKPTAELFLGQTDESDLGAEYKVIDKILEMYIENDLSINEIVNKGFKKTLAQKIVKRVKLNEHKRKPPIIIRVSEKSFHHTEWRMPITNGYEG